MSIIVQTILSMIKQLKCPRCGRPMTVDEKRRNELCEACLDREDKDRKSRDDSRRSS